MEGHAYARRLKENEKKLLVDLMSKNVTPRDILSTLKELLWGFVALEALDILEGELQLLSRHQLDSSNCGCKLRHSCGLPCDCMLSVYLNSGDVFWRKLDLSPSTSVENEDICCNGELEMFKENFTK
ncbi:hypothetical protein Gotur_001022 [Gossypium turneri]